MVCIDAYVLSGDKLLLRSVDVPSYAVKLNLCVSFYTMTFICSPSKQFLFQQANVPVSLLSERCKNIALNIVVVNIFTDE